MPVHTIFHLCLLLQPASPQPVVNCTCAQPEHPANSMRSWARSRRSLGPRAGAVWIVLPAAHLCMAPARLQPMPCHAVHLHGVGVHWADTGARHAHACSTRLLHPPPAPDGSPHGLRTQAPSSYHISTTHAPWWGDRAENGPPGRSCHGPKSAEGAPTLGCPHGPHGPPFPAPTPMLDGS